MSRSVAGSLRRAAPAVLRWVAGPRRRPGRVRSVLVLAVLVPLAACGGGSGKKVEAALPVPVEIVPTTLTDFGLTLQPNTDQETADAFTTAGPNALVGDGKVWELRAADRLVGALQLSTLKSRVNPAREADRKAVLGQILPGTNERIDIAGQPVWTAKGSQTKAMYVFFGAHSLGILQLKGKGLEVDRISADLIARIASQPLWDALPPEVFEDKPAET